MNFRSERTGQYIDSTRLYISIVLVLSLMFINTFDIAAQNCTISTPSDPVQYSIDADCSDTLTIAMLGVVTSDCNGPFQISLIFNGNNVGNIVTQDMVGETLMFIVSDSGGNSGMGEILVLDKQDPIVDCNAITDQIIDCYTDWETVPGLTEDDVAECSDFDIYHYDVVMDSDCDSNYEAVITRTWVVIDEYGNDTSCVQTIYIERVNLDQVIMPEHVYLYCGPELDTSKTATGQPTINGAPITPDFPCNLLVTYSDRPPIPKPDCGYKILRNWVVMDWCADEINTIEYTQVLDVSDTTAPLIIAPADMTIAADEFDCLVNLEIPPATITDVCSDFVVTTTGPFIPIHSNGGFVDGLGLGLVDVTYTAIDDCGNTSSDVMTITIEDQHTPVALCDQSKTVSINDYGFAVLPAEEFDDGSYDACNEVFFKIKRMTANPSCFNDGNENNQFDDFIKFCCDDIDDSPIMVRMRVYDTNPGIGIIGEEELEGHFTECMVELNVQDKIGPNITAPDDITIDCRYPFAFDNLSVFGEVVTDPEDISPILINGEIVGEDGLASDNCEVLVSTNYTENIGCGGLGYIQRVFTATDNGGNIDIDVQTITIINDDLFSAEDIEWPGDFILENCTSGVDTSITGVPIIDENGCSLLGINFSDDAYYSVPDVCFKIVRTWKVIDWCQQVEGEYATWSWQQTIKVIDSNPPSISLPDTGITADNYSENCGEMLIELLAPIVDDCTPTEDILLSYFIDEGGDGEFEQSGQGGTSTVSLPNGIHTVIVQADDQCGNTATKSYEITITDKKAPSPVVLNGVAIELMNMGNGEGMIEIVASSLNSSSTDNCTDESALHYTFSEDYDETTVIFNCEDVGEQIVSVYVWDTDGNFDVVMTTVDVQDNMLICSNSTSNSIKITGNIEDENGLSISDVQVMAEHEDNMIESMSNQNGEFSIDALDSGEDYVIIPAKNSNPKNGVSTYDLVQIQKHIIGLEELSSPYKMIAADINNNGSISAIDIIELRKLILGVYGEFPNNKSWRFIDANYVFTSLDNALHQDFNEYYAIEDLTDPMDLSFKGLKVGDVNNSAAVNDVILSEERSEGKKDLYYINEETKGGQHYIHVYASNIKDVIGTQFSIVIDPMQILDYQVLYDEMYFKKEYIFDKQNEFKINVSWNETSPQEFDDKNALISIKYTRSKQYKGTDLITLDNGELNPEIYIEGSGINELVLLPATLATQETTLKFLGNRPNPFSDNTTLTFSSERTGEYYLQIQDVNGRVIYTKKDRATKGTNEIEIGYDEGLHENGIYFFTLSNGKESTSGKLIRIK